MARVYVNSAAFDLWVMSEVRDDVFRQLPTYIERRPDVLKVEGARRVAIGPSNMGGFYCRVFVDSDRLQDSNPLQGFMDAIKNQVDTYIKNEQAKPAPIQ